MSVRYILGYILLGACIGTFLSAGMLHLLVRRETKEQQGGAEATALELPNERDGF